ncbi:hypothetical protein V6N13_073869 [Hibiscus sabdariffa]
MVWAAVIKSEKLNEFYSTPVREWLRFNLSQPTRRLQTVVATAIRSNLQPSHWSVVPRCRIGWLPPRLGCVKLNNDGIFRSSDVHASCVRVIRNSLSAWCHECLG